MQDEWNAEAPLPSPSWDGPRVAVVLLVQFLASMLMALFAGGVALAWAHSMGYDEGLLAGDIDADAPQETRMALRLVLGLSHLSMFLLAGFFTVRIFYSRFWDGAQQRWAGWAEYLGVHHAPSAGQIGWAVAAMLVVLPLVLFSYEINKLAPLPEWIKAMESSQESTLKALLKMDNGWEFAANMALIALLPALGEELVFRGVVQQQLMRAFRSPQVALLVSATVFSLVHFPELSGFLPRLLLGLLLGWFFYRTHNLWISMAAHFFNNGLQIFAQYLYLRGLSGTDLAEQDLQIPLPAALVSLGLTAGALWMFNRRRMSRSSDNIS